MKNLTWQNPEQLFVAQELINKVKSKCCGIKDKETSAQLSVPAGMDKLLVFRATGDNHVFLGYRQQNTFEVIFIEYNFGDIYSHG